MARLHLYRHGKRVSTLEVASRPYLVGREKSCDLVLEEPSSSREHFSIAPHEKGGFAPEDIDRLERDGVTVAPAPQAAE